MAIRLRGKRRSHGIVWKTGEIYTFRYQSWENDPQPTIILMYGVEGNHPRTGHQHRYYQGVNLSYIPRGDRRKFVSEWQKIHMDNNGNVEFTWDLVQNRYPYLKNAVRRYFFKPSYYIQNATHISMENAEEAVISTWSKDFSKKVRVELVRKFRSLMGRRKSKGII